MHLPDFLRRALLRACVRFVEQRRPPDVVIGEADNPYLKRWWVVPRNNWYNVYFHHFMRSDDDRALHDHPYASCSLLLDAGYFEVVPRDKNDPWSEPIRMRRFMGDVIFRPRGEYAHRIVLLPFPWHSTREQMVRTIFITGPRRREWGFICPRGKWKHWKDFTAATPGSSSGKVGAGCGEEDL